MNTDFLKSSIKGAGYTQEEFAEEIGIGYSTLKNYLAGIVTPDVNIFTKMCDKLGIPYQFALDKSFSQHKSTKQEYITNHIISLLKIKGYKMKITDGIYYEKSGQVLSFDDIKQLGHNIEKYMDFELYNLANE